MDGPVLKLFQALGEKGDRRVIGALRTLIESNLKPSQKEALYKYLQETDFKDTVALQDMEAMLRSKDFEGVPEDIYTENNELVAFRSYVRKQESIPLHSKDGVSYDLKTPGTDIRVEGIMSDVENITFAVIVSAYGCGSKIFFILKVDIDGWACKEPEHLLNEIIIKCRILLKDSSLTFIRHLQDKFVEKMVKDPTRENADLVKGKLLLLENLYPHMDKDLFILRILNNETKRVLHHMHKKYTEGQEVDAQLVEQLVYLQDMLGFALTDDCLVLKNKSESVVDSTWPFILVKQNDIWIRGCPTEPAYERLLLAHKLQE